MKNDANNIYIKLLLIVVLLSGFLFLSVSYPLAGEDAKHKESKKIIAVKEFDSNDKQLSKMMAEWTISVLFEKKDYKVVERMLLNEILNEHKLSGSGLVSPGSMSKLGNLTGASHILMGSIGKVGEKYLITLKIVKIDSAETVESFRGSTDDIDKLPNLLVSLLNKQQMEEARTSPTVIDNSQWTGYYQYPDARRGYIKGHFTVYFRMDPHGRIMGDIVEPRTDFGPNTKTLHSIIENGYYDKANRQINFTKVYDYDGHAVNYVGNIVGDDVMTGRWNIGSYTGSWRAIRKK